MALVSFSVSETLDQDVEKGILHRSAVSIVGLFHSQDPTEMNLKNGAAIVTENNQKKNK